MAEGAVRLYSRFGGSMGEAIALTDPLAVKVRPHGVFGYRQKPGAQFDYPATKSHARTNALGYRGPEVATPKPAGTFRIILLGESTTHGWGVDDSETIDAHMRREVALRLPGRHIEVVNLAFDGYDAYQIWQRLLSDGFRLQPDLVIVNTGVNDVRNARIPHLSGDPDPRTLLYDAELRRLRRERDQGGASLWTTTKHWLYLARIVGVLRSRRQADVRMARVPEIQVSLDAAGNFERNVARIADTLARAHLPLLLSTPPSALTMQGVAAAILPRSYWLSDAASTQRYRDTLAARLQTIVQHGIASGTQIGYVPHVMPPHVFLDDCHLTSEGNRLEAADFTAAIVPFLTPQLGPSPIRSQRPPAT